MTHNIAMPTWPGIAVPVIAVPIRIFTITYIRTCRLYNLQVVYVCVHDVPQKEDVRRTYA